MKRNRVADGPKTVTVDPKRTMRKAWGRAAAKAVQAEATAGQRGLKEFWAGFNTTSSESSSESSESSSDSEPEFQIGIPGARAMFGENKNPYRRAIWIALCLGFLMLTIVQVQERIGYYLSTPVSINLNVEQTDVLDFPLVTVCTREPFNATAMELLRPLAALKLNKNPEQVKLPYDLVAVMDLEKLWRNISFRIDLMAYECFFGRNKSCDDTGQWLLVHTIMGPCHTFQADRGVTETGLFNGLYIQLNASRLDGVKARKNAPAAPSASTENGIRPLVSLAEDVTFDVNTKGWRFLPHDGRATPTLDVYNGINLNPGWNVDSQVGLRQFVGKNVWHSPCVDDPDYDIAKCQVECLSAEIITRSGCRLPFMNDSSIVWKAPMCSTPDEYEKADYALQSLVKGSQFNVGGCSCQRQCYKNDFEIYNEVVAGKSNRIRFRVFYQDKSYENVEEDIIYELITLFCDIGNSMGLFLGASVLTGFELLEWSGYFTHKWSLGIRQRSKMKKQVVKKFQTSKKLVETSSQKIS